MLIQPQSYLWGFSFLQLFITLLCFTVWSLGVYYISVLSHLCLKQTGRAEVPTKYKATIELVQAMQREFAERGEDLAELTGPQLAHRLRQDLRGGRMEVPAATAGPAGLGGLGRTLREWLHWEKWWFAVMAVLTLFLIGGWSLLMFPPLNVFYWMALCWTIGMYVAMAAGRTTRSRFFIVACGVLLGLIVYAVGTWQWFVHRPPTVFHQVSNIY